MGFVFIDKYDVGACAELCNARGPDGNGGACQYFNIWRAVVKGVPTTYTCSFVSLRSTRWWIFAYTLSSTISSPMSPPPTTSDKRISTLPIHAATGASHLFKTVVLRPTQGAPRLSTAGLNLPKLGLPRALQLVTSMP